MTNSIEFISKRYGIVFFYNPSTGVSMWVKDDTPYVYGVSKSWKQIISAMDKPYYYNTETGISQWKIPENSNSNSNSNSNCMSITGLNWTGNSCYIDSVLQALFSVPNSFSYKILNEKLKDDNKIAIQEELINISNTLMGILSPGVQNVRKLRSLFKQFPVSEKYHNTHMKDSGEFLTYLISLFTSGSLAKTHTISYGTNSLNSIVPTNEMIIGSIVVDDFASVVINIDPMTLLEQEDEIDITNYLIEYNDAVLDEPYIINGSSYIRRISTKKILSTPIIIFNFNRMNPVDNEVIHIAIRPVPNIELDNFIYNFTAVVHFSDRHYICYFMCDEVWYLYNDIPVASISLIGTLDDLLDNTDVMTDGTTFYYTSQNAGLNI
jgi:ubiquitin C-terminal hydrolase